MTTNNKCYSLNGEDFIHDSLKDCFDEMVECGTFKVGVVYHEAMFKRVSAADIIDVAYLIEDTDNRLYDVVGEAAEDGIDVCGEAVIELEEFLEDWLNRHSDVSKYWTVVGTPTIKTVTQGDIDEHLSIH